MIGFTESFPFFGICKNAAATHKFLLFPVNNFFRYFKKACMMWDKQKCTNNFAFPVTIL